MMEDINNLNIINSEIAAEILKFKDKDKKVSISSTTVTPIPTITNNNNNDLLNVPLAAIRPSTTQCLSILLNPLKIIPSEAGLPRDWRGIAELAGMKSETIAYLESKTDPTGELLKKISKSGNIPTINDLKAYLAVIDRFDVVEDANPLLEKDAEAYSLALSSTLVSSQHKVSLNSSSDDHDVLTIGDITFGGKPSYYDAFILNSEEDSEFANQIIEKMEKEYNLKMCVKDRDILPGVMFEHEVIGRLIEERCNRLLVIFSPSFLESQANHFLVSYAQALALEKRQRKIIPCMYKLCQLPPSVRYSFCLNYSRAGKLWNFWDKLANSLKSSSPKNSDNSQINNNLSESNKLSITNESFLNKTDQVLNDNGLEKSKSIDWWDPEKKTGSNPVSLSGENSHLKAQDSSKGISTLNQNQNESNKSFKWIDKFRIKHKNKSHKDNISSSQDIKSTKVKKSSKNKKKEEALLAD